MIKIIVLLADGFEEIEALSVVDIMRRAGLTCDMCSMDGSYVKGSHGIEVKADTLFMNSDIDGYDVLVLPGGMPGSTNLMNDERVIQTVKKFAEQGRIVAAICAAPIVLNKAGVINKRML